MAGELDGAASGVAKSVLGTLVPYAIPAMQAFGGIVQAISGNKRANTLRKQLKPYQTPAELVKILNASQAAMGDTSYQDYATTQIGRTTSQNLGAAMRLGANPNQLSAAFNESVNAIMKVGQDQHTINMQNFGRFLDSLKMMGDSKNAERVSKNNLLKDEIQQASTDKAQGIQNIGNAINTGIGIYAAQKTGDLFKLPAPAANNAQLDNNVAPVTEQQVSMEGLAPAQSFGQNYMDLMRQFYGKQ